MEEAPVLVEGDDYKRAKEAFVSNLNGNSLGEVILVLGIAPISALLFRMLMSTIRSHGIEVNAVLSFVIGFLVQALPLMLAFVGRIYSIYMVLIACCIILWGWAQIKNKPLSAFTTPERVALENFGLEQKGFLTTYRGYLAMGTCFAILAVDFPIFPREHAKTESYGISLMDIGVGSFVMSHAITASRTTRSFRSKMMSIIPMFVLGFIRLAMVKASNYQEHVTEYGMHWNFFFTMGFVSFSFIVFGFIDVKWRVLFACFALLVGQFDLTYLESAAYVQDPSRGDSIWSQNKEGIASLCGYIVLFLFGSSIGSIFAEVPLDISKWWNSALKFTLLAAISPLVIWISSFICEPISRKLANTPYVFAVVAVNSFTLAAMMFVDLFIRAPHTQPKFSSRYNPHQANARTSAIDYGLIHAISRNQLFLFLLANILTGIINMSMQTIYASNGVAMAVLTCYMLFLCSCAYILDYLDITVRLR